MPRCLGAAQELGWEDKKSVIGVINGNCVMMALLQALPTARHFREGVMVSALGLCMGKRQNEKGKYRPGTRIMYSILVSVKYSSVLYVMGLRLMLYLHTGHLFIFLQQLVNTSLVCGYFAH